LKTIEFGDLHFYSITITIRLTERMKR
jgi:hypothetical protein